VPEQAGVVILLLIAAVVLLTLGYRIRVRREWHLIAGAELHNVRDREGLGRWVGGIGIVLGTVSLAAAACAAVRPDLNAAMGSSYATAVCTLTGVMALGCLRYVL
jgi:hypothetical protein